MNSKPKEIWLQWKADEVTWCVDQQHDDDVRYIRADLLKEVFGGLDITFDYILEEREESDKYCCRCNGKLIDSQLCESRVILAHRTTTYSDIFGVDGWGYDVRLCRSCASDLFNFLDKHDWNPEEWII